MTAVTWDLVAETLEWVGPITVTADGDPVTNFEVSLTLGAERPSTWLTADADPDGSSTPGILVGGDSWPLAPSKKYTIFVRFTDNPEIPVLRAGYIKTT